LLIILILNMTVSTHRKTPGEATEIHVTLIIKMAFIKEESEDMKIEETLRVKEEDTEEQTGWFYSQT